MQRASILSGHVVKSIVPQLFFTWRSHISTCSLDTSIPIVEFKCIIVKWLNTYIAVCFLISVSVFTSQQVNNTRTKSINRICNYYCITWSCTFYLSFTTPLSSFYTQPPSRGSLAKTYLIILSHPSVSFQRYVLLLSYLWIRPDLLPSVSFQ